MSMVRYSSVFCSDLSFIGAVGIVFVEFGSGARDGSAARVAGGVAPGTLAGADHKPNHSPPSIDRAPPSTTRRTSKLRKNV